MRAGAARKKDVRPDPAPGFPLRVGVVDMGSNAIRLLAAEFIAPSTYTELLSDRIPVRLGHGVFRTGRLDDAAVDGAVQAMERFRDVLDELEIERYRAVTTSAVRESDNGQDLVDRVREATDLRLEIITGAEEARLVYWAARGKLPLDRDHPWVMADLGGGSLEVAVVDADGMRSVESLTIGSVRLYEELEDAGSRRFHRLLDRYLSGLRVSVLEGRNDLGGFAATGGNMEDLAALAKAKPDEGGVSVIPLDDLEDVIETLAGLSVEERVANLGLREDRADVILPAAMVYERLARLLEADAIHVPHVGVKEGVLFDLVEELVTRSGYTERHARDVMAGAVALGRRYAFDEAHAVHVARLALELFDQLEALHELGDDEREIMAAAAVLHDVGQRIGYERHHKHSYYLISQSELPGFTLRAVELVANVARYHRKAFPSPKHEAFAALDDGDRKTVTKLSALLRIADALDREHAQTVTAVRATVDHDELQIELEGRSDRSIEWWALERKCDLFEDTFNLEVVNGDESDRGRDDDE